MSERAQRFGAALFDEVLARAAASPRGRINHNFHPTLEDPVHRFLNVVTRGSYVTPHRHTTPPRSESFVVLRGAIAFWIFDDDGTVHLTSVLEEPGRGRECGIDVPPGEWHSMAALSDHAVCFEVKAGPYVRVSDKDFAPWAPREGQPECAAWLHELIARTVPRPPL